MKKEMSEKDYPMPTGIMREFYLAGIEISESQAESIRVIIREYLSVGLPNPLDGIINICRPAEILYEDYFEMNKRKPTLNPLTLFWRIYTGDTEKSDGIMSLILFAVLVAAIVALACIQ